MEKIKTKKNDSIDNHFNKYKTFYLSILIVSILLFVWCKYGKKILDYCFAESTNIEKSSNNEIQNNLLEIHSILSSMN